MVGYAGEDRGEGEPQEEIQTLLPGGSAGAGSAHADAVSLRPSRRAAMILCLVAGANR